VDLRARQKPAKLLCRSSTNEIDRALLEAFLFGVWAMADLR
jgi:hypothetical protein